MKPAPFAYHAPRTLDEALDLLTEHGADAKPLAGGQSLIPAMNFRLATPAMLVDLNAVKTLDYISANNNVVRIGAMTRHRALERSPEIHSRLPLIAEAMPFIAHAAIRTRGTLGGSLAHADPAAELPAVMVALGAQLTLSSRTAQRTLAAEHFFTGLFTTALEPGELLTEIAIAPNIHTRCAFQEVARRHGDYALAGVAVALEVTAEGRVADARIVLLSVGDGPVIAGAAIRALLGESPTPDAIRAAAHAAAQDGIDPPGDIHASAAYRRQLIEVLTRRTVAHAVNRSDQSSAREP